MKGGHFTVLQVFWVSGLIEDSQIFICVSAASVAMSDFTQPVENTLLRRQWGEKRQITCWQYYQKWFGHHENPRKGLGGPICIFCMKGQRWGAKTVVGMEAETVRLESGVGRGWGKGSKHGGRVCWPACLLIKCQGQSQRQNRNLKTVGSSAHWSSSCGQADGLGVTRSLWETETHRTEPRSDGSQVLMEAGFGPMYFWFH